ncbi:MAG: HD domain-containing protein [Clostridia bacterium]|nr:HD domain-containing protein [Clostridia bacterium]
MEDIIARAADYARALFAGDSSGHDWWHTRRVWRLALHLAEAEGADPLIVQLAALLHDADDAKLSPETSAEKLRARRFLEAEGLPEETIRRILHIIGQVSYKGSDSETPDSIEGMCVQDADRLDAIGAVGIARTFAFGGSRGRAIWDPDEQPRTELNERNYRSGGGCTVNHFYEKLLLLKDLMNTPAARRMAEARHRFMEQYLDEFYAEWRGDR